ncbi:MAG: exodeoxyribonuclease V subunit gamma [Kofleriaceae bacterium]
MLRAVHSNRVESLLAALFDALPPADPFAPSTVVVGSHLVQRWLTRELAFARGIAAGLELVTFDRFVERAWSDATAELASIDRAQLATLLASVLADGAVVRGLPAVAAYLDAAPDPGDRAGPRRVQLASHLAGLCWNYATTRPDWMPALINGHVPGELANEPMAHWQAQLIAAAFARLVKAQPTRHHVLAPMLPWARRRLHLPPPALAPVAVFGVSYLARAQLEALTDLATTTDVTVYALDPCEELWDDVGGRKALAMSTEGATDPLPLVLWGKPIRDTLAALVERSGGDVDAVFVDQDPVTARERLLEDVRARRVPIDLRAPFGSSPIGERETSAPGTTVFACPNARREIEAIAADVRRRLDADPSLHAHEVGVWLAGDHERYLAQAPSAFDAVGVPCHLVDAPVDDRGRIGEAMIALLDLPTSTMARRDLLRVMTHPAVLAGHPHVAAEDWVRWTERLGIAFGADSDAHKGTYLEEHPGHFHWDQGVRRLALGAFMVGERAGRPPVRIAGLDVAPEELRPDQQASAATFALLVRSLSDDAQWLARHEAPLATWAQVFAGIVDVYLAPRDQDATRDIERVRAMLAGLAHLDLDGRPLGFREAREHASRALETMRANRGEPLAAGVMVAPLATMRAVPFRVVYVAGLDEGVFPAGDIASPLDLRREVRAGDVSPRDRDRAAFLEVMLCARDALTLSYVAVEAKSGQPLGPSSVVLELADALAPYVGAAASRDALERMTVRVPLHRFGSMGSGTARSAGSSGAGAGTGSSTVVAPGGVGSSGVASARSNGVGSSGPVSATNGGGELDVAPAAVRKRWACTVRDAVRAHLRAAKLPIPDEDGLLALLGHPALADLRAALGVISAPPAVTATAVSRSVAIANLRDFLESPVQAWAQAVLGLGELPDDATQEHSDEPFHLDRPERATLLREVFASQLRDAGAPGALDGVTRTSSSAPSRGGNVIPLHAGATIPIAKRYETAMSAAQLRGQFPVGVFAEAERVIDLRMLETWTRALGPVPADAATRFGFGRASSPGAQLLPALELQLSGGRTVRLTGQTELLIREGGRHTSVIALIREYERKSPYHLRGAFDHLVLAAAGLAPTGHAHKLIDPLGKVVEIEHAPWSTEEARAYLTAIATELLDVPHGYLLPFAELARCLFAQRPQTRFFDPTKGLGWGPIERKDGLAVPADAHAMAKRRLGPLVEHMRGDHGFVEPKGFPR